MKTYCVKQRKQTECVPGSETYAMARNGRRMMKCKCAECGIAKTRFVKGTTGKGLLLGKNSPFRKIPVLELYFKEIKYKINIMLTYCVQQRKQTECVPGSETFLVTKNGRNAMKCQCAECGITKFRFLSKREGSGFDELIVKGLAAGTKGLFNLGRIGASKAIKSDFAKKKMKEVGEKYLGQVIDSVTDDLSKKIDPRSGGRVDIHKAIGKLPRPKRGWTLPGHKYTGPYNDLEKQVKYDPGTGEILEIYDQPTGTTDAIAMQHDADYTVCGDDKKCKHGADKKMVQALDAVPWNERQWGHWLARNAINAKRKLGLGAKRKGKKKKRPKFKLARSIS